MFSLIEKVIYVEFNFRLKYYIFTIILVQEYSPYMYNVHSPLLFITIYLYSCTKFKLEKRSNSTYFLVQTFSRREKKSQNYCVHAVRKSISRSTSREPFPKRFLEPLYPRYTTKHSPPS